MFQPNAEIQCCRECSFLALLQLKCTWFLALQCSCTGAKLRDEQRVSNTTNQCSIQHENNKDHISKHYASQSEELMQKETKNGNDEVFIGIALAVQNIKDRIQKFRNLVMDKRCFNKGGNWMHYLTNGFQTLMQLYCRITLKNTLLPLQEISIHPSCNPTSVYKVLF